MAALQVGMAAAQGIRLVWSREGVEEGEVPPAARRRWQGVSREGKGVPLEAGRNPRAIAREVVEKGGRLRGVKKHPGEVLEALVESLEAEKGESPPDGKEWGWRYGRFEVGAYGGKADWEMQTCGLRSAGLGGCAVSGHRSIGVRGGRRRSWSSMAPGEGRNPHLCRSVAGHEVPGRWRTASFGGWR